MSQPNSFHTLLTLLTTGLLASACSGSAGEPVDPSEPDQPIGTEIATDDDTPTLVAGTVRDSSTGERIGGATVCATSLDNCEVLDESGAFELDAGTAGDDVPLYVFADGYHASRVLAHVAGAPTHLDVPVIPTRSAEVGPLATEGAVLFRIIDLMGMAPAALAGVEVHVDAYVAQYTDASGRFGADLGATSTDGLALIANVPLGELPVSAAESFGGDCFALTHGGLNAETTVSVEVGVVTMLDVLCM